MNVLKKLERLEYPKSRQDVLLVSEAAYNILYGIVPLNPLEKKYFKSQKRLFKILLSKKTWKQKLEVLNQKFVEQLLVVALRHLNG